MAAALLGGTAVAADAATYYVDRSSASCSNTGTGTVDHPYCTISAAVGARGGPGVVILVKPAVYAEQVTINKSGSPGNPLVLRAIGSGVVVDGADDFSDPAKWDHYDDDVWLAASVSWNPKQVFADGARLAFDNKDPDDIPPGTFQWVSGEGLYVNVGGGHPADHQVRVGRRNYGFSLFGRSWITIEGFYVTGTEDRAINVSGSCTNIHLTRNAVSFARRMGIQISGGSDMILSSNTVSHSKDHGISLVSGVTRSTLEDNESSGNAHPTQVLANGIYLFASPGNTMRANRLHHNQDSGIHLQSGSNNCFLLLNHSWSNGDHGFDQLGATGTIHVLSVAYGNYRDGFSIEGGATGTQIYNSIAIDNGLTSNHSDLWVEGGSTAGFVSDYNLFWNSTSQKPIKYISTRYATVAAYSAATGQDAHSLQADPLFLGAVAGDFRVDRASPVIGEGEAGAGAIWPTTGDGGPFRLRRFLPGLDPQTGSVRQVLGGSPEEDARQSMQESPAAPPSVAPNPFARNATLRFSTSRQGPVAVAIFDLGGRRVRTLVDDRATPAGAHVLPLDDRADGGGRLAAGVYLYRIRSVDGLSHGRFVLTK